MTAESAAVPRSSYVYGTGVAWPGWPTIVGFAVFCFCVALTALFYRLDTVQAGPAATPEFFFVGESVEAAELHLRSDTGGLMDVALWVEVPMEAELAADPGVAALGRDWAPAVVTTRPDGSAISWEWSDRVEAYTREQEGQTLAGIPVGITPDSPTTTWAITLPPLEAHGFALGYVRSDNVINGLPLLWLLPGLVGLGVALARLRPERSQLHLDEEAEADRRDLERYRARSRADSRARAANAAAYSAYQARASRAYTQGLSAFRGDPQAASAYAAQSAGPAPIGDPGPYSNLIFFGLLALVFGAPILGALGAIGNYGIRMLTTAAPATPVLPLDGDTPWRFLVSLTVLSLVAGGVPLVGSMLVPRLRGRRLRLVLIVTAIVFAIAVVALGAWSSSLTVVRGVP